MMTQKHGDATAKNVEFCTLFLDQVTTLLAKRLARITPFLFLMLMSTILVPCAANFLYCHE
jgi:peptidoglycan/LPS O-acetylase OafA/YrhL